MKTYISPPHIVYDNRGPVKPGELIPNWEAREIWIDKYKKNLFEKLCTIFFPEEIYWHGWQVDAGSAPTRYRLWFMGEKFAETEGFDFSVYIYNSQGRPIKSHEELSLQDAINEISAMYGMNNINPDEMMIKIREAAGWKPL